MNFKSYNKKLQKVPWDFNNLVGILEFGEALIVFNFMDFFLDILFFKFSGVKSISAFKITLNSNKIVQFLYFKIALKGTVMQIENW